MSNSTALTWREEIAAGEQAVALDPNLEAYDALYRAYYPKGWLTKMRHVLERMVDLNPDDQKILDQLGWLHWFTGHPERALPYLERAISISPSSPWSHFYLGNASLALELFEQAEAAYDKAVALANLSSGQIGIICTFLSHGKDEEAIERNAKYRTSHDSDRYFVKAADVELLLGNRQEARVLAEQGAADAPDERYFPRGVLAATILGCVLWDDNRAAAQRWLNQSAKIDYARLADGDESPMPRYNLAAIHAVKGDAEAACRWLHGALDAGWRGTRLAMRDPLLRNIRDSEPFLRILAAARVTLDASRANS